MNCRDRRRDGRGPGDRGPWRHPRRPWTRPQASSLGLGRLCGGLALAALGVVYGDIGTSPLYTIKKASARPAGRTLEEANVLGTLSLVFWSLILVVTSNTSAHLRADNRGEGGVLALGTPSPRACASARPRLDADLVASISGPALFYGDGLITPAISVLARSRASDRRTGARP